ncbi:MAG: M36 family metallopeptidase [Flavobacteriales bacterium]|nr:M36 family metallopeptidase [Flavobacteriales bacterium]
MITKLIEAELVPKGFTPQDLSDLVVRDKYSSHNGAVIHTFLRQRHGGIEVFNGDIAVHTKQNGELIALNNGAVKGLAEKVNSVTPSFSAEQAMSQVLQREGLTFSTTQLDKHDPDRKRWSYIDVASTDGPINVQLMYLAKDQEVFLVWDVEFQLPDGSHWWKVRIDASTGTELDRNDMVAQCSFDHPSHNDQPCLPESPFAPPEPNDYNVYSWPTESPSHGPRSLQNSPWNAALNASPYGWHDTNGAPGAEYTITRGNNVHAQEDQNGNNGTGYSPNGSATLDFNFPINLTQQPSTYTDAAVTNLFYWNNIIHDVLYQYGFDEQSGNFQSNNYGNGGLGNDYVQADAQDGSGTNNANFGTPPDGALPRMQMFLWDGSPQIDGDLDNGVITHEYGHGVSNRLVGGASNTSCLSNNEQMGEGWSDFLAMMMTMEPGDMGPDARGMGTFVVGEPISGPGIRPSPYSTSFSVNNYTYGNTNSGVSVPHGIGFVWCTILWEVTWDLIDQYGYDPDIYNGTGGNNMAIQLVIDGMKLTPCNPGFVDARDAILLADQINNGGANYLLLYTAFARRGLGYSADQGSVYSRSDQTEAFDLPIDINAVCNQILSPVTGQVGACEPPPDMVKVNFRNNGIQPIVDLPVRYRLDAGTVVNETIQGALQPGTDTTYTFLAPLNATSLGPHAVKVWTAAVGEGYLLDDTLLVSFNTVQNTGGLNLTLKPGPLDGKDATIWLLTTQNGPFGPTNTTNYGVNQNYYALEWTWNSSVGRIHSLMEFDLSSIPAGSTILSSSLSLYGNTAVTTGGHSTLSGSNAAKLQRITSAWNEQTVTWNNRPTFTAANEVALAPSISNDQDYLNIDVTDLVNDMVQDPANSHGFQLSTITPQFYRALVFASSDHPDPMKWPELKICYVPPAGTNATCQHVVNPMPGTLGSCGTPPNEVTVNFKNNGSLPIQDLPVNFSLDGGPAVGEMIIGTMLPGDDTTYTFIALPNASVGPHVLEVWCAAVGEGYPLDDTLSVAFDLLPNNGSAQLILKPGPTEGKDAIVWFLNDQNGPFGPTNTTNYGNGPSNYAMEWTWLGSSGTTNALMEFDMSSIPIGSSVQSADLSLYGNPTSVDGGHSTLSGSNASKLQRITSSWNEQTVTWNNKPTVTTAGEVSLAESSAPFEDYLGIDVTTLVHDMVLDPSISHGFQFSISSPDHYRRMIFSSSDHPDSQLWPELKVCCVPPAKLNARVFLDGPFEVGSALMSDALRTMSLLPLTEPYSALGFVQVGGGGEATVQSVLNTPGANAIVDWVYVALSPSGSEADIVATRNALLQRDGDVVDMDGVSPVRFIVPIGQYRVIIKHRNHLGVVTNSSHNISATQTTSIDLSNGSVQAYGIDPMKLEGSTYTLWAGDVSHDGLIQYTGLGNDRDLILVEIGGVVPTNTVVGYSTSDVNMNGQIKYTGLGNDRDPILLNIGGVNPTTIRAAQFP